MPQRDNRVRTQLPFAFGRISPLALATMAALLASFVFGGASRLHELRLGLVELVALPALVMGLSALVRPDCARPTRLAMMIAAGLALIPMMQLIPLPPAVWTALPGRDQPALALELAGLTPPWAPLSLTPDKTWRSFLALLPPLAVLVGVINCPPDFRKKLVTVLLGFALVSIVFGAAQAASGSERLYLWSTTNAGSVVGFFANRNHLATLVLLSLPFAAVLGARDLRRSGEGRRLALSFSAMYLALAVVAIAVIRSRMGLVLFGPAVAASLLAAWVAAGRGRPKPLLLGLMASTAVAIAAVGVFALGPVLARFDTTGVREGRFENWPIVAEASNTYLPLGSGLGSFDPIYRSVEPLEQLDATFFNQAHNEYLEIWLETGWFGAALILAFLVWFVRRSWTAWRAKPGLERDLQRAASVAIGVVLAHSLVDYPLRTETIAVIFAMCCALLELSTRSDGDLTTASTSRRQRRRRTAA